MIDVKVETEALERASRTLRRRSEKMESVTDFLIKRLNAIHSEFDDVNYDRTLEAIIGVRSGIHSISATADALGRDLKKLEAIIEDYANGGYKG